MIYCSYHGNDTSADLYVAVFIHPPRQANFTLKMRKRAKIFHFQVNFATLSESTTLNFSCIVPVNCFNQMKNKI